MADMSALKISAICATTSIISFLGAIIRGDFMCASSFTACLLLAFFTFGLAALIFVIVGVFRRTRANSVPKSN